MNLSKHSIVNVCLNDWNNNPLCCHGPTVLFERILNEGKVKKFYACSASRDRKKCSFYLEEDKMKDFQQESSLDKEILLSKKHAIKYKKFLQFSKLLESKNIVYCETCNCLYDNSCEVKKHANCTVISILSEEQIEFPSKIFSPKNNSKCEAQYLFSDESLEVILKSLQDLEIEKVLCVGVPTLFEKVNKSSANMKSLLMDIDNRYCNFISSKKFCLYNMFNHYFFCGSKSKEYYRKFLNNSDKMLMIIDPPFGGKMELIANTIQVIEKEWRDINNFSDDRVLPTILIFPYFLEKSVKASLPSFSMLEYQVNYSNHSSYSKGPRGMKHGSAVRMFTNLSPHLFALPEKEGYKFCSACNRWVHSHNIHCVKCKSCTSKDGRTYVHCDICGICVKPAWVHCDNCNRCLPRDHKCKPSVKVVSKRIQTKSKRKRESQSTNAKKSKKNTIPLTVLEEKERDKLVLQQIFKK